MASSGMLRHVALVTDVSEELSASSIRVSRLGELGTTLLTANVVPISPNLVTLMKEGLSSSEMPVITRATRRKIPEDDILHRQTISHITNWRNTEITIYYIQLIR
jgi:hypothetical protein